MKLEIISDGEFGVSQGSLASAFVNEIKAFGYIRKGWLTSQGPCEKVKWLGIQEIDTDRIRDCAQRCIDECNAILLFKSGELTKIEENIIALNANARPIYIFDFQKPDDPRCITTWALTEGISKLYVTGRVDSIGLDIFFKKTYSIMNHFIKDITSEYSRIELSNRHKDSTSKQKAKDPDEK